MSIGYTNAVIFDMDGTLLNTLEDIAISNNRALDSHGYPVHPSESYKHFVGNGIRNLVRMSLPIELYNDESKVEEVLTTFRSFYKDLWYINTRPYPGIAQLLDSLEDSSIPKSIVTNKSAEFAETMVTGSLGGWTFDHVIGEIPGKFKKPDPSGVRVVLDTWNIDAEHVYFVGDSTVDMMTAKNSGTIPVAVSWGFESPEELLRAGAKFLLNSPQDLLKLLSS